MKQYALSLLFVISFSAQTVFSDNCPSVETFKAQPVGSVFEYGRFNQLISYEARGSRFYDSNHTWRILYKFQTPDVNGLSRANDIRSNINSGYTTTNRQDEINEWYCLYHSSADPRALIMASYSF